MIKGYIRFRRMAVMLYALMVVLFPLIQFLYGLPLQPVLYGIIVATFFLAAGGVYDYYRYQQRARALDAVLTHVSTAAHALPAADGPIEERYHQALSELYQLLRQQKDEMQRRHNEQMDYYTMWVHQIKTPIAAMRLTMQAGNHSGAMEEQLFLIERYVEMALQYVKMNAIAGDLLIEEYDVGTIVNGVVKKYATFFIGRKLSIDIHVKGLRVSTDKRWLSFILEQIVSNAVKYTNKGGVSITGSGNTLTVRDTGIGIRPEDVQRIFHKGYTGYNGRMDQRSSGIGLYMAKYVADQLSIRIFVESALGTGTSVTLVFPKAFETIE